MSKKEDKTLGVVRDPRIETGSMGPRQPSKPATAVKPTQGGGDKKE